MLSEYMSDLVFNASLYEKFPLPGAKVGENYDKTNLLLSWENIEGHCPGCKRISFFKGSYNATGVFLQGRHGRIDPEFINYKFLCTRNIKHFITTIFLFEGTSLQKIGQYRSLADIQTDMVRDYRKVMDKEQGQEFYKAIGLFAHGIGIGSFVYLRRIFESIVINKFRLKVNSGISEKEFISKFMKEKIEFLKDDLPAFLVKNSEIYSILSKGIHELSEDECKRHFPVIRDAIAIILQQDLDEKQINEMIVQLNREINLRKGS